MKIAFIVNSATEPLQTYSWPLLSLNAQKKGHEVFLIELGELIYAPDGSINAMAFRIPDRKNRSLEAYLQSLREMKDREEISAEELEVILLKFDLGSEQNNWAQDAVINFAQMAKKKNVLVLNEPTTLMYSTQKMYIQEFPREVRVETLVSRNKEKIREFYKSQDEEVVLKPLLSRNGEDVFLLKQNATNLNQMVDAIARQGYVVAQRFLDTSKLGRVRLVMMNGEPLVCEDKHCAVKHQNGKVIAVKEKELQQTIDIASYCGPKLKKDGIFLAEIEVVGDKLMAVHTMNSNGVNYGTEIYKLPFAAEIIRSLESKMEYRKIYRDHLSNFELAVYS